MVAERMKPGSLIGTQDKESARTFATWGDSNHHAAHHNPGPASGGCP